MPIFDSAQVEELAKTFASGESGIAGDKPQLGEYEINIAELRQLLETNHEFFIHFFLSDELTVPIPDFHLDEFQRMVAPKIPRYCAAIPRGHAKTTLAKLACVYLILFSRYSFFVYLSASHGIAAPACRDIIAFIESENFRAVFGPVEYRIRREAEGYFEFRIPSIDKNVILRAQGAGQQVRGLNIGNRRPDCAFIDDFEDVETTASPTSFQHLVRWLYGTFFKALNQFGAKIVQIGNMVAQDCILRRHIESPAWASTLYGALLDTGKPLWPDLWPIDALIADFKEYQAMGLTDVWFREMMNVPIAPDGGLIRTDEITFRPPVVPGQPLHTFVTLDPAISKKRWGHRMCAVAHGYVYNEENGMGWWQILEYIHGRGINPVLLWPSLASLMIRWRARLCAIESIAYQDSLRYVLEDYARNEGLFTLEFVPISVPNASKTMRLAAWAGELKADKTNLRPPIYSLTRGDWGMMQQLISYDPQSERNDDDLIDAAAYGPPTIRKYLPRIQLPWQELVRQSRGHFIPAPRTSAFY